MKINTTRFGDVEIDDNKIINFPLGIPGFPNMKRYFLIDYKEPIKWLHAVDDPDTAFITASPFSFFPDYSFSMKDDVETFLEIKKPEDAAIIVILIVADNALHANLKAPIIINSSTLKGVQILLDDERYAFREPLPALPQEENSAK
ncbi:MAG: flagellar assembly protein FliW [Nitrospirae bacterium]|nr:flagellar assembly protein FliW [Nitrospirota bacterium]